jgi:hypothetical protein
MRIVDAWRWDDADSAALAIFAAEQALLDAHYARSPESLEWRVVDAARTAREVARATVSYAALYANYGIERLFHAFRVTAHNQHLTDLLVARQQAHEAEQRADKHLNEWMLAHLSHLAQDMGDKTDA